MERNSHFQGVNKASNGYKLLAGMGWKEGEGLGVNKQGMASHVRVAKKSDTSGVGAAQEAAKTQDWSLGMLAYDKLLESLKPVAESEQMAKIGKRKRAHPSQDASLYNSEPGVPPVSEAPVMEKLSKKRKKAVELKKGGSGEAAAQQGEVRVTLKKISHTGRFHKRVKNKLVSGYSETDLSAILGERVHEQLQPEEAAQAPSSRVGHCEVDAGEAKRRDAGTQQSETAIGASEGNDLTEPVWWRGYFLQAGGSGSQGTYSAFQPVQREVQIAGFSEQDQANLWQNVTDAQNKNKQGLGQASTFKHAAGVEWQGKRTVIHDEEEQDAGKPESSHTTAADHNRSQEQWKTCKKLAKKALNGAKNKRMRLKELKSRLHDELGACETVIDLQNLIERLGHSKKFSVERKWIAFCGP